MLLAAASDKKISAKQGALNKQLKIPADLEIAIAAAIGEYSDAFLLDEMSESDTALDLLQDNGGRAALLPLNGLSPMQPLKRPDHKDCLGVASAMVDAPTKLQPAVDLLLGQVLVVRNRRAARDILKDQPEQVRAVTLSGELFYKTGQIFVDAKGGTGILSRPREQQELKNNIEIENAKLKEISVKIDILDQQISEQINEKSEIEKNDQSITEKLEAARKVFQEFTVELAQATQKQTWQRGQLKDSELEHENTLKEMQSSGEERVSIDEEIMGLEKELGAENLSLSNLPVEELQEQVRQWNTQIALRQKSLQEGRLRQQESQRALTKIIEQKKDLETQKQSLVRQRADLQDKMRHSSGSDEELTGQISALEVQVLPAEEELGALESDHDGLISGEQLARDALSAAERQNSQAQIGYSRQQEALETLQRRIEDDFGLVEFEYDDSVSGPTPLPLGDLVEHLPIVTELSPEIEDSLKRQRAQLRRIGSINPEAQKEYEQVQERYDFLTDQVEDLTRAEEDVREVIAELEGMMEREFRKTFDLVAKEFRGIFSRLFGGGSARLILTDAENFSDAGVEIEARLPGKRPQRLALLSGGERSLTATALVFALLKASPTPFCVMDEVDAMLDEANVGRFTELLSEFSQETQFILITHNRNTVQAADVIYGVTMGRDTASQIISLKLDDVDERYAVEAA